jgi:probable rRNA maturation factor
MIRVSVANSQDRAPVNVPRLKEVVRTVLEGESIKEAKISLAFVDNPTIHDINKRFLNHDEPTDVITFPLSAPRAKTLEGELVIGAEVGLQQATERGHDVETELSLYVIHGLLHLCGYDDRTDEDSARMREAERYHLGELGLPDIAGE